MTQASGLRAERERLLDEGRASFAAAEAEARGLTDAERTRDDEIVARVTEIDADLPRWERNEANEAAVVARRDAQVAEAAQSMAAPGADAEKKMPTPFKSVGEQLIAVAHSQMAIESGGHADSRLLEINAALGANEAVPSEGGFAVQTDLAPGMINRVWDTGVLFKKTDNTTVGANANGLKINAIDETSRATGSRWGGVRAYWLAEAATKTASKPTYRQMELTLNKIAAVYYATDELLQDATALQQEVENSFLGELAFVVDDSLIRGTGAGMPLGILNSAGTLSVGAEAGQTADTIIAENIWAMYFRMHPASIPNAEWFINQGVLAQLQQLQAVVGIGGVPLFQPAGGISAAPFGTLLGRPITPIEHASALGDVGDIIFADWRAYKTISKGGVQTASSIHVAFLTDETAFRWVLRVDGQPKFNTVLTPYLGTGTLSSFITLAAR